MEIIKCTVCGGNLRMVSDNEGICNYCESVVKINSIPTKIKVDGISGIEDYLKRGDAWIKLEEWNKAVEVFDTVVQLEPTLPAGYIGKFISLTWNFKRHRYGNDYYENYSKFFEVEDMWRFFEYKIATEEIKSTMFFENCKNYFTNMEKSIDKDMDYAIKNGYPTYDMLVEDVFILEAQKNRIVVTGKIAGVLTLARRCKFIDNSNGNIIARGAILGIEENRKLKSGISVNRKCERVDVGICIKIYDTNIDMQALINTLILDEDFNIDTI